MRDEKHTPEVGAWLKGREVRPFDSEYAARRVASRLPRIRQRSRWWPFPVVYRKSTSGTSIDMTKSQPDPIPATNGHTPTVIGRTQSMFSPVKVITAGALVFVIGGAFLISQPFQQQGSVPGATADVAPTWVTGSVQPAPSCSSGDSELDGDVRRSRNVECSPQTWTSSDHRLTGEAVRRWNEDAYQTDEGSISIGMDAAYLRNDGGGWACSNSYLAKDAVDVADPLIFDCIGDGGYAGLAAMLVLEDAEGNAEDFVGLIFSGDFPPLPEPPATE